MTIKRLLYAHLLISLKGKKLSFIIQPPSEGFSIGCFSPVGLSAERPWNDVKNSQYFSYVMTSKETNNKHTKYIMDSVICRVNAGVGAVVAIKDYLLETQNKQTHLFEKLYSIGTQEILTMNVQSF